MKQTSYLSLFVIGVLLVGGITPSTLAFADDDKVKLEIEREDGITKIEIETSELDVELKLENADSNEIIDVILSYVDLPDEVIEKLSHIDDSDFEFEYEYETDSDNQDKKAYVCHKGETIKISKNAIDAHLAHGDYLGECEDFEHDGTICGPGATLIDGVCIVDDDALDEESDKAEALESIHDAIEEIEEAITQLQHAHDAGIDVSDAEEIIIKAKTLLHDADAAFELGHFDQAIELADHAEDLADEVRFILGDDFDDDADDTDDHNDNNSDNSHLEQRIAELEEENEQLREQIVQLEEHIENLNAMLMEQLKVIYEWILNR